MSANIFKIMNVDFLTAVKMFFANYVNFKGRSTRAEFWWAMLFCLLCGAVANMISSYLQGILSLAFLLPTLAVSTRRFHDTGRSGWWVLGFYVVTYLVAGVCFYSILQVATTGNEQAIIQAVQGSAARISIGSLVLLALSIWWIIILCKPSGPDNQYGPNPYGK